TPYYADTFIFVYNTDHLQRAGFAAPPATLDELTKQAEAIKAKGIAEFPIVLGWGQQDPFSIESFTALVFAQRNGSLFDKDLKPGESRATVGFIRFYAVSSQVPRRGKEAMTAAWNFLDYFGGKTDGEYRITKRWSLEKGLGFAQTALFADKDIRAAFGKWADVDMLQKQAQLARAKEGMTPYYGTWDVFSRAELHKAYLGQQKPVETLANMAKKWEELKAKAK